MAFYYGFDYGGVVGAEVYEAVGHAGLGVVSFGYGLGMGMGDIRTSQSASKKANEAVYMVANVSRTVESAVDGML